ncbi:MAG: hypothetical protein HY553_10960 [Elusimicrobia bacterium]|nr:hypothetical protein [Elusimicrobiota bacterium]
MTLLALLLALPVLAADSGHLCNGGEKARYAFEAAKDTACRSEQEHVCKCRRELRRIPGDDGGWVDSTQSYYDASRDLCLDNWVHFQCLERGGDWRCAARGRCACDAKPRRCVEKDLTAWKDYACGAGDCEETRLLQGREPKQGVDCKGGGRWRCVTDAKCPKTGKKVCLESDFGRWRDIGCGVGGCSAGQMRVVRDKKTHLLCDNARWQKCRPDPLCASRKKS